MREMCASKMKRGVHLFLAFFLCVMTSNAQPEQPPTPEPYPPDMLLKGILDFREPTALRGMILYIDREKQVIWLDWAQLSVDRPRFEKGWKLVPNEWIIAVHPLNQSQFYDLQQMAKESILELVIQTDQEGLRRIVTFEKLTLLPKVHTTLSTKGIIPEN